MSPMAWSQGSFHVPPSLCLIVQSFVCRRLLVLLSDIPLRREAANNAYPSTGDDQTAGVLVARLLRAEL
jgi:hypothetical protein